MCHVLQPLYFCLHGGVIPSGLLWPELHTCACTWQCISGLKAAVCIHHLQSHVLLVRMIFDV